MPRSMTCVSRSRPFLRLPPALDCWFAEKPCSCVVIEVGADVVWANMLRDMYGWRNVFE
jgi:hypothetical protein